MWQTGLSEPLPALLHVGICVISHQQLLALPGGTKPPRTKRGALMMCRRVSHMSWHIRCHIKARLLISARGRDKYSYSKDVPWRWLSAKPSLTGSIMKAISSPEYVWSRSCELSSSPRGLCVSQNVVCVCVCVTLYCQHLYPHFWMIWRGRVPPWLQARHGSGKVMLITVRAACVWEINRPHLLKAKTSLLELRAEPLCETSQLQRKLYR